MFIAFIRMLRRYGISVGMGDVLRFYRGLRDGLAKSVDELFLFARLCFVRRVEEYDAYERAFLSYFMGVELPPVAPGDPELLHTRQFQEWLRSAVARGEIQPVSQNLSPEELMRRFWETVRSQTEAHHGGNRWVGTGGTSPFGHSGHADRGVRVFGDSSRKSAVKVFGDRRYVDYSADRSLHSGPHGNIRQALESLKRLQPAGAPVELNLEETIYRTAKNGGEIDLVFERELKDRLKLMLFLDNGGTSMLPHVDVTRSLFQRIQGRLRRLSTYYFHNTVYESVYRDAARRQPVTVQSLLSEDPETRVIFLGDAIMGPQELSSPYGSIDPRDECHEPSLSTLTRLRDRFQRCVWLNPISREWWQGRAAWSLERIREIFPMEDMTPGGIRRAVQILNSGTRRP